ncbi:phosphonate C-P lyase system protein PhnH [Aquabacter cavernae]|uniref:phosphonate C-P lyase system protein PhnH n=1 Tax=Aquabacter cavernae TaxID=2496029 RepID=UPI000F8CA18A|nr:phosphonate C-P lyase system protein PhnH [Aquabacter cavernae]
MSDISQAQASLARGFNDPARDSQTAFRALMYAMARPGVPRALEARLSPPAPLTPELAALALTVLDYETTVWLDPALAGEAAVVDFLRFHTSARLVTEPEAAQFALIADGSALPAFSRFAQGEPDYPDRSTTLLVAVSSFTDGPFQVEGPGLPAPVGFGATPLPADMTQRLAENRALFPLGIDLVLAAPGAILALPRSVRVREEA